MSEFKLRMTSKIALRLETAVTETRGLEFSGLGFIKQEKGGLCIYDAVVLNVGSEGYTEIDPKKIMPLLDREDAKNIKCWFHRHPIGNGIPGKNNWSAMDEATIQEAPLGGIPQIVGWSVSIVRTPRGWVGRVDNHIERTTVHVPVYPLLPENYIQEIREMTPKRLNAIPLQKGTDQKKPAAIPMGQYLGMATKKVTGTTTPTMTMTKDTISSPSGEFDVQLTLSEWLDVIAELQAIDPEILEYPMVWTDADGNAYPVRFDPMTGRVRNGRFVLDEPANVLCVN